MNVCVFLCLSISVSTSWFVLGVVALALLIAYLLAGMFGPMPRYDIRDEDSICGSTLARILMQLLIASATSTIAITTPYFLPDKTLMREHCRVIEPGVNVQILTPARRATIC